MTSLLSPDHQEWYEERAAIMFYDGRLSREQAEAEALRCAIDFFGLDDPPSAPSPAYLDGLRPYQADAVQATLAALQEGHHPVITLPTGAGKSHCIAALAAAVAGRVLVVTHRKELVRQDHAKHAGDDAGIYSAGLKQRDLDSRVLYAGVNSIYQRMSLLQETGDFDAIIVDECHRISPPDEPSMYGTVFEACPNAKRIGLSATPYRLMSGAVWGPDRWFSMCSADVAIADLTPEYLAPLVGVLTAADIDVSAVRTRAGDFVVSDLSQVACEEDVVEGACDEICTLAAQRKKWLVFCVDKIHTRLVHAALVKRGIAAEWLTEDRETARDHLVTNFHAGAYRALVNCEILTTGLDVPDIDCIVLLRPSQSKGLIVQMLGRGCRQAPGKTDALVLDCAGNLERHVPLDGVPVLIKSPARDIADEERERLAQAERERLARHSRTASAIDPMARCAGGTQRYRVTHMSYRVVRSKKADVDMLLATYVCPERMPHTLVQFVCLEHAGYPGQKAQEWCARRAIPAQYWTTARQTLHYLQQHTMNCPAQILVEEDTKWPRVKMEYFVIDS